MRAFLFAAVLVTQMSTAAWAQGIPHFSMTTLCHTEAKTDPCVQSEGNALAELQRDWSKFPASARPTCMREISAGGPPSYTELLVCLQMADWAGSQTTNQPQKEPQTTGSASKPSRPRLH